MSRPKYKELYEEAAEQLKFYKDEHVKLSKTLLDERTTALNTSKERAVIRRNWIDLHNKALMFLDRIQQDIMSPAVEKNDWLYLAALGPEDAYALRNGFSKFSAYLDEKKPPIL